MGEKSSGGCFAVIGKITCFIIAVVVLAGVFGGKNDTSETPSRQDEATVTETQGATAESSSVNTTTARPTKTPKPTNTPKPTATPEPTTLQGWAESIANAVYGSYDEKYSSLRSVTCEQVDGENAPMVTLNVDYPDSFMRKNDDRMGSFLYSAKNANAKFAERAKEGKFEYGSLRIVGWTTYSDKYGNFSDGMAAEIRVKAVEAAKVNWDIAHFTAEMLPGVAVSFGINPVIRDGLSLEYLAEIRE